MVRPSRAFLVLLTFAISPFLSGCQVTYLVKSAYFQASLLNKREPIDKALESTALSDENKRKLRLAKEAREFAEKSLDVIRDEPAKLKGIAGLGGRRAVKASRALRDQGPWP